VMTRCVPTCHLYWSRCLLPKMDSSKYPIGQDGAWNSPKTFWTDFRRKINSTPGIATHWKNLWPVKIVEEIRIYREFWESLRLSRYWTSSFNSPVCLASTAIRHRRTEPCLEVSPRPGFFDVGVGSLAEFYSPNVSNSLTMYEYNYR
jgi:hypothetical protein